MSLGLRHHHLDLEPAAGISRTGGGFAHGPPDAARGARLAVARRDATRDAVAEVGGAFVDLDHQVRSRVLDGCRLTGRLKIT